MIDRRNVLQSLLAGSSLLTLSKSALVQSSTLGRAHTKRLRILMLGATGHLGPYFIAAAQKRGHKVSVFSRGRDSGKTSENVELLIGDRNNHLESIKNRKWDSVIDIATYGPSWVRSLGEALRGRVGHYTFISSINVYDQTDSHEDVTTESSPLAVYKSNVDPYTKIQPDEQYGALKVLCEKEAEHQFPGKVLVLRPSYIVGPGDSVGAFTYIAVRAQAGGEIMAAGDPLSRVHFIDGRDLAQWTIALIERSTQGIFSAVGPATPTNWGGLLRSVRSTSPVLSKATWVPLAWLADHGYSDAFSNLLFWQSGICTAGAKLISNERALRAGLGLRPLQDSLADTRGWYERLPPDQQTKFLLGKSGPGTTTLQDLLSQERELLSKWHKDAGDT